MSCQKPITVKEKKGFTLVEVLIVLVIISIMSGLLITVIDPAKQRARARDGTVSATANKIIATIAAYNSAIGSFPSCEDLAGATSPEIQNVVAASRVECTNAGAEPNDGSFSINGISLPSTTTTGCDTTQGYSLAVGTGPCKFRYETDATRANACLGAKLNAKADLDGDGDANQFLYWSSATGILVDNDGSTLCNL